MKSTIYSSMVGIKVVYKSIFVKSIFISTKSQARTWFVESVSGTPAGDSKRPCPRKSAARNCRAAYAIGHDIAVCALVRKSLDENRTLPTGVTTRAVIGT